MEEVIQREKDLVYRLAFSQCHQKDQADDIFQNVMYRYLKRKPTFESSEHEKAWFIRVTLNCSKTSLKSFWNNRVEEIDEQAYIFEKKEIDLTPYLNKLPKKYNAVLYLFYYEGYSTKEMAKLLHIKENNVRVLLNRARNQLRKEIESDEK
ncbi:RNA polymerase sigma factor [Faecalibacillus faecis]|jgi:RNA polymerase sigma-70 factor, ECF subfamily|uniref:RNA polymerase sigma factor n=1 Tax=Faecalibacillus faecis TaxID=1982628 RepID=UPI000664B6A0|nr:sigma-70 family RNA polymerase sigma factor [Faecalibacillus faecis]KMV78087.1 RNA polymerase sigma-24 factor protein [Coprobacillus sp. 8_1_38FAA]RHB03633.1 sigma-70 family RNA polymerase sigma factor [Coprobacillus sp. AM42-12AC]RHH10163.1 sigma-70 family RNA polymerase sigma factor [Coprobacillus sp. AM18-4LB-d2]RHP23805.1 sigma-70 family RNA polymerase sigma factor [Coprobacillus sp. AF34-1BH]RHQ85511.1 sigma-70 family RNA polymerase sigma factor [Coprobacillus sp. AF21-8LB]